MNIKQNSSVTFTSTGSLNTWNIDLGATASVNIIQCIYLTFMTVNSGSNPYKIGTWDGTTFIPFFINGANTAAGISQIFTKGNQIISPVRYIQIQYNGNAAGDILDVAISYFQIANTNTISSNFLAAHGSTGNASTTILTAPGTGGYSIKSIYVLETAGTPTNARILLNNAGVQSPISVVMSLTSATEIVCSNTQLNLSIINPFTLVLTNSAPSAALDYYISYTYDPLDV